MKVTKISPRGYCKGVVQAINIAKKARTQYPDEKITILGMLVHNSYITEALEALNIQSIEHDNMTRYDLLDEIDEGVVIFTAHGISKKVKEKAQQKGLICVDASCSDVISTQVLVDEKLNEGYEILYVGKLGHPEAESVCFKEDRVHLITSIDDVKQYADIDKVFVTNQTTMSLFDVFAIFEEIKELIPNAVFADEICNATRIRQEAVAAIDKDVDCLIVVGDKKSNNSTKLAQIAKENGVACVHQIDSILDLQHIDLATIEHIAVTAGASTPTYLTTSVIEYLEKYPNIDDLEFDMSKIL